MEPCPGSFVACERGYQSGEVVDLCRIEDSMPPAKEKAKASQLEKADHQTVAGCSLPFIVGWCFRTSAKG